MANLPLPDQPAPTLSIVIVNWNSRELLRQCLQSVQAFTRQASHEVIVIDSGSFDGCDKMLAREFPSARFIQSRENVGFARANNLAAATARGEVLLFLNPDTRLMNDAVDQMLAQLQRLPRAGALGCRLLNADGSLQTSCVQSFPTLVNQFFSAESLRRRYPASPLWGMAALFAPGPGPARVEMVSGACLMMRREVFERIGRFSEEYFMYAEDLDLCYQATRAGYLNHYLPGAVVMHYGGGSSEKAPSDFAVVMMRDSIWRFLRKTRGRLYGVAYRLAMSLSALGRLLLLALPGRPAAAPVLREGSRRKWRAVLAWSMGLKTAAPERH